MVYGVNVLFKLGVRGETDLLRASGTKDVGSGD